jgi:hypothetical protein
MRVMANIGGDTVACKVPFVGAQYVIADLEACPSCGAKPVELRGSAPQQRHDHYTSDAMTLCCKKFVGQMTAWPDTLFGIDEDQTVLNHGRCRVYGPNGTYEGKL